MLMSLFFLSFENFTDGLSNENITLKREDDTLLFELYQGSAKVTGRVTQEEFFAEVVMVKKEKANVALKRYILERNYQLTYARYFSDDTFIKLKIFHKNTTMTPQKIFFPIRELALNADYDKEHIKSAVYGLPEIYHDKLKGADLVANPGCYPTATILGLLPFLEL